MQENAINKRRLSMDDPSSAPSDDYYLSFSAKEFRERYSTRLYWWTWHVTQLIGAYLAPRFLRMGIHPNVISVASAISGVSTSVLVVLLYGAWPILAAAVAFVGWQLSFTLDYTDGQVARAGGMTSTHGAVLDLLCDHVVQSVTVLAAVHIAISNLQTSWAPTIAAAIAVAWLIPFVHGISFTAWRAPTPGSLAVKGSKIATFLKQGRDYGIQISVVALAIALGSWVLLGVLVVIISANFTLAVYNIYSMATKRDAA
jgi:phosphatidylglycerophosphate synthase